MLASWILVPFILQAIVIGIDEGYFHIKRGLPKWERIGHPVDTLSLLGCLCYALMVPPSPIAIKGFIALAIFSCLLVTKDEFVHKHHCPASEQWLHALLFINHPILLTSLGLLWPFVHAQEGISSLAIWHEAVGFLKGFLYVQIALTSLFMLYQIIYWNFLCKEQKIK